MTTIHLQNILLFGDGGAFNPGKFYDITHAVHSILRYLILLSIIYCVFSSWRGWKKKLQFTKRPALLTMSLADVQLLIGIYLALVNMMNLTYNLDRPRRILKAPFEVRFTILEHPVMMLLAIMLIHIGYAKSKRAATDAGKYKTIFIFYLIALLIILAAIPWPMMNTGGNWWPKF